MTLNGVVLAGFMTIPQPAATACAAPMLGMSMGQFHGPMTPTTPMGSCQMKMRLSTVSSCCIGLTRPRCRLMPSPAAIQWSMA